MTRTPICFDATGTLIETAEDVGEVYHRVALAFGVDLPAWRLDDAFRRVLRNAPPRGVEGASVEARREAEVEWWGERIRQTFQATDSTARFADFPAFARALFDAYRGPDAWRARANVPEVLRVLHDRGYPMGVVSNFDHRLPEILEGLGLDAFFEFILTPSECGASKPERRVFEAAAASFGTTIEQLVYVGDDRPEVLEEIASLGLRVIAIETGSELAAIPDWLERAATLPRRVERGLPEAQVDPDNENQKGLLRDEP